MINARDAIGNKKNGKITVKLRNVESNDGAGNIALIEISDNGCGIPAEKIDRIFTPFQTSKADGTGLGLVAVKRIVRAHGGECAVRSNVGKGTTFSIRLPL